MLNDLLTDNGPAIINAATQVILLVLSGILTYATTKLPAKWRKEGENAALGAEQKLRDSLHSAAESGVEAGRALGLTGAELVLYGLKHVLKSVPDAIVGLTPSYVTDDLIKSGPVENVVKRLPQGTRDVLENIVRSKINLGEVLDAVKYHS